MTDTLSSYEKEPSAAATTPQQETDVPQDSTLLRHHGGATENDALETNEYTPLDNDSESTPEEKITALDDESSLPNTDEDAAPEGQSTLSDDERNTRSAHEATTETDEAPAFEDIAGKNKAAAPESATENGDAPGLRIPFLLEGQAAASAGTCYRAIGVRLHKAGQVYFFPDDELDVKIGSQVILELEHGPSFGEVDSIVHGEKPWQPDTETPAGDGRILGLATAQDIARHAENMILAAESTAFCKTCIRQRKLDMKLVDVEVLHDRSKIIFFFTAPARIDFRDLVKDLVRNYRTRIELRQIGVRHETQMIGGIGNCGMVCCCHKYLRKFAPVTIKMAKEQNLFLNPSKLSGMCGRLLCCLSFEQGNYEEFNRRCPKLGKRYDTTNGTVRVLRANMFGQSIVVLPETGEELELSLEEWEGLEPKRAEAPAPEQRPAAPSPRKQPPPRKGKARDDYKKVPLEQEWEQLSEDPELSASHPKHEKREHSRPWKHKRPAEPAE